MSSLTGELEFTPSLAQVGDHELMLAASDGRFRIYQDFTRTVTKRALPGFVWVD